MTIEPGIEPLTLYQGCSFHEHFTWTDEKDAPIDLTGYQGRMQARPSPDSARTFLDLSTANGGMTLGGAQGTVTVQMGPEATAAIKDMAGYYDIELTAPDGSVVRLLMGHITVSPEVTR